MDTAIKDNSSTAISESFNWNKIILLIAAGLILRAFFLFETPIMPLQVGDSTPDFRLELFDGKEITGKGILGKPHVFFFFAGWCPCANLSVPFLKRAHEEYASKGVSFVGVGFQDTRESLNSFVSRHNLTFPAGPDVNNEVGNLFGIATPPVTVFVNSEGKIASIFSGKVKKYEDLQPHLEKLI